MARIKLLTDAGLRRLMQLINAKFADKLNKSDIVNDLTTGGSNKALSAEQGKVLFQNVDDGKQRIANAIIDKGQAGVSKESTFQELADAIASIQGGGSAEPEYIPQTTDDSIFLNTRTSNVSSFLNSNRNKIVTFPNLWRIDYNGYKLFSGLQHLRVVPGLDMKRTTNAFGMFLNCRMLEIVGEFKTSADLENVAQMFKGCSKLKFFPKFDISGVLNFADIFAECVALDIAKMRAAGWPENYLQTAPNYSRP